MKMMTIMMMKKEEEEDDEDDEDDDDEDHYEGRMKMKKNKYDHLKKNVLFHYKL